MDWLWLAGWFLIGFFVGRSLRGRAPQNLQASKFNELALNMASDRELMLLTFRRELANFMVRHDPDRFLRTYRKAHAAEAAISNADNAERGAQLTIITKKYPLYQDFDLMGTRDYVLYADALSMYSLEDIEEHYLNLVKFHALERVLDEGWKFRSPATSDSEVEHLEKYVQKIKDTKFRQRLMAVVDEFYAVTRIPSRKEGQIAYETDALAVYRVPRIAETRYGFHFKDTNEFGLYGSFYDDTRDRNYRNFYRSDRKFEAEIYLDHLRIDEHI